MIIEQVDALKVWLTNKLSPICDAEPSALAKYVCALVKKDKVEQDLRDICNDQLEVFLQQNTKPFVDELFEALKSKIYIPPATELKPRPAPIVPLVKHESRSPSHRGSKEKEDVQKKKVSEISSTTDDKENKNSVVAVTSATSTSTSNIFSNSKELTTDQVSRIIKDSATGESLSKVMKDPPREVREPRATSRDGREKDRDDDVSRDRRDSWKDDRSREGIRDARDIIRDRERDKVDSRLDRDKIDSRLDRDKIDSRLDRDKIDSRLDRDKIDSRLDRDKVDLKLDRDKVDPKLDTREVREPRDRDYRDRDYRRRRTRSRSYSPRRREFDVDRRRKFEERPRYSPDRRWGRRRSWSRSPRRNRSPLDRAIGRPRSRSPRLRSRSPRERYRSFRSRTRSRTRSPRPRSWSRPGSAIRLRTRSPSNARLPDSRGSTPLQDNDYISSSTNDLPTVTSIVGYRPLGEDRGENRLPHSYEGPPSNFVQGGRAHCQNFEEKGFCMLGDVCPYDHGSDPVVVEDVSIPNVMSGASSAGIPSSSGGFIPPDIRLPPPGHMGMRINMQRPPPPHVEPYLPEAPGLHKLPFMGVPLPDLRQPPPGMMLNRPPQPDQFYMPRREVVLNHLPPHLDDGGDMIDSVRSDKEPPRIVIPAKRPYSAISNDPNAMNIGPPPPRMALVGQPPHVFEVIPPLHPSFPSQNKPPPRRGFDYSRLGVRGKVPLPRLPFRPGNVTLEVRKIPHELNNIAKLNEHFGKFGNLTNIQVKFQSDPGAALISFSNNSEASAAYRSPEPVFNNRFIKLFWHNAEKQINLDGETESPVVVTVGDDGRDVQIQQTTITGGRVGDGIDHPSLMLPIRPSIPPAHKLTLDNTKAKVNTTHSAAAGSETSTTNTNSADKSIVYTSSVGNLKKTVFNPSATALAIARAKIAAPFVSPTAVKTADHVSRMEAISRAEEERKLAAVKQTELEQKRQELLAKQIQQQKILLDTLEKRKATMNEEEKKDLWKALRTISDAIDKVKYSTGAKRPQPSTFQPLAADQFKYISNHEPHTVTYGRGRGWPGGRSSGWAPRGRGHTPPFLSRTHLDNRPKTIEVKGFDLSELEEIKLHFQRFGEIDKVDIVQEVPSIFLTFASRPSAEMAVSQGGKFKKKTLIVRWNQITPKISRTESTQSSEVDDDLSITLGSLNEDTLLDLSSADKPDKVPSPFSVPGSPQELDKDSQVFEEDNTTTEENLPAPSQKPVFERSLSEDLLTIGEEHFKASYTDDEDEEDHITVTLSNIPSSTQSLFSADSGFIIPSQEGNNTDLTEEEQNNFDHSNLDYNEDGPWA